MKYLEFREKYNVKCFIVFSVHQYYSSQIMIKEKRRIFGNIFRKLGGKVQLEDMAIDSTVTFNYILRKL